MLTANHSMDGLALFTMQYDLCVDNTDHYIYTIEEAYWKLNGMWWRFLFLINLRDTKADSYVVVSDTAGSWNKHQMH